MVGKRWERKRDIEVGEGGKVGKIGKEVGTE